LASEFILKLSISRHQALGRPNVVLRPSAARQPVPDLSERLIFDNLCLCIQTLRRLERAIGLVLSGLVANNWVKKERFWGADSGILGRRWLSLCLFNAKFRLLSASHLRHLLQNLDRFSHWVKFDDTASVAWRGSSSQRGSSSVFKISTRSIKLLPYSYEARWNSPSLCFKTDAGGTC